MGPPTLWYVIGGLLTLTCIPEPPTFTVMYSTEVCRRGLTGDPSRSSRNPDRSEGKTGSSLTSFDLVSMSNQNRTSFGTRSTIGCGRCPIMQAETGVPFPVGRSSLRLLAMHFLSQARRLGGLHRASSVPFRGSYFTLHSIVQRYAPRAHRLPV
jgi:hypothetical protein